MGMSLTSCLGLLVFLTHGVFLRRKRTSKLRAYDVGADDTRRRH